MGKGLRGGLLSPPPNWPKGVLKLYVWDLYHMLVSTSKCLYGAIWNYLELPGAIMRYLKLPGATWNYLELPGAIRSYLELS